MMDLSDGELVARIVQRDLMDEEMAHKTVKHARDGCGECIRWIEEELG